MTEKEWVAAWNRAMKQALEAAVLVADTCRNAPDHTDPGALRTAALECFERNVW